MTFGAALEALKTGHKVMRPGWNGKGMWIRLRAPGSDSQMSLPDGQMSLSYIYMRTVQGDLVPWLASQTDMLAEDWEQVAEVGGGVT